MLTKTSRYKHGRKGQQKPSTFTRQGSQVQTLLRPFSKSEKFRPGSYRSEVGGSQGCEEIVSSATTRTHVAAPQNLVIKLRRTRTGFEASAKATKPQLDVWSVSATAKGALFDLMDGVVASLSALEGA